VRPVYQSRVGPNGRCFSACLASILEIPERSVPDLDNTNTAQVDRFLAQYGLQYRRIPYGADKPVGYSTIEGISPRGGYHACVALDGRLIFDPHPPDGTGRGLVSAEAYGLLLPAMRKASDALFKRGGGAFYIQVTEPDGSEHTMPVSQAARGKDRAGRK
jgi:hypothetical protein